MNRESAIAMHIYHVILLNVCVLVHCFRLESVRKDVECCFGRLKKRFRILRLPFMFVYEAQIHDTFHCFRLQPYCTTGY